MYRARDELAHEEWLERLEAAADELTLGADARSRARDIFLAAVPERRRSKPAAVAASLYAGALLASDRRSQAAVAEAVGVSRLTVHNRWQDQLVAAGFEPPDW